MEKNKKQQQDPGPEGKQSCAEWFGNPGEPFPCDHQELPGDPEDMEQLGSLNVVILGLSLMDGKHFLQSEHLVPTERIDGREGAWRCQRNYKYFILLNQMEKAKLFPFQVEVMETSFHSRFIGALPSHQSLETKQKRRAEIVKHKSGARTSRAGVGVRS